MKPVIYISQIVDEYVRKNFENLKSYFDSNSQISDLKHIEFSVSRNETNVKIKHGLGFIPRDIIVTRPIAPTSAAKLVLNWGLFTATDIDVTVTGLSDGETFKIRMLVGNLQQNSESVALEETDIQEIKGRY